MFTFHGVNFELIRLAYVGELSFELTDEIIDLWPYASPF